MVPHEIEEVEPTGDIDSVKAPGEEIATTSKVETRPSLTFLSIFKDAKIPINTSDPAKLCKILSKGVFLENYAGVSLQKGKPLEPNCIKYFVDKENKNCFMLFARVLSIIWGLHEKYWRWNKEKDSGKDIEVVELKNVCYLQISCKIWTVDLSPGTLYEIVFIIKIKEDNRMPDVTLKLTVVPPDARFVPRYEKINDKPLEQWIEMVAGEFVMSPENVGDVTFRLEETETGLWKSGLLVKCAILRPRSLEAIQLMPIPFSSRAAEGDIDDA